MLLRDDNEAIIRPPAEAGSFILLVTRGCSHNKCTFCGAYRERKFGVRPFEEVAATIGAEAANDPDHRRVFLADGNAMVLKTAELERILDELASALPRLARVGLYANAGDVLSKSDQELRLLADKKLALAYIGLESGNEEVLRRIKKGSTAVEMTEAVRRLQSVGIKVSLIALLGLAGKELSAAHVRDSVEIINQMQPTMLSFLSLMLIPGTPLDRAVERGEFSIPDDLAILEELRGMVAGLELESTVFRSNHASNYLPLAGRLPKDKQRLLAEIDGALAGETPLRPEYWRGL